MGVWGRMRDASDTRKRELGRGLFFEVAEGNVGEFGGEAGEVGEITFFGGGFGGEEEFVVADGEMVEQIFLFTEGF